MGKTLDLGERIELLPMDNHCHDISIGLYRRTVGGVPQFLPHTYSSVSGAVGRVDFMRHALVQMIGLEEVPNIPGWLRFPCHTIHQRALRRAFLDLCKLETGSPLKAKPLTVFDKKAGGNLTAVALGDGRYEMVGEEGGSKRSEALARGFVKLCEMDIVEGQPNQVAFSCGKSHDALIGMLMFRSQNVRSSIIEDDMAASRGILASPSQQQL